MAGLVAAPLSARADPPDADAYVREVLERNPSVKARALRRDALGHESRAAGIYPDPQVAVMVDRVPQAHEAEMPMVRYQVTQMFPWPGKLPRMRASVEKQEEGAAADLEVRKLDLRLDAKRAYYMLALVAKRREILQASRSLAATIAQASLGRYATGTGSHHEVARAQVEVSALDVEASDLDGERASAIAMANALRDAPADAPFADPILVPSPRSDATTTTTAMVERAYAQRPELRGMRAMQDESLAMAELALRERYPDVMGSLWLNQSFGAPPSAGAMVGVTIPVFGASRQGKRASAFEARAAGAATDARAMRAMIRFEITDAAVRVQTTSRRVELVETVVVPKARESFEASIAGYGAGSVDIVGLLDARRSLQSASLALAEARTAREIALAELERATGAPLAAGTP